MSGENSNTSTPFALFCSSRSEPTRKDDKCTEITDKAEISLTDGYIQYEHAQFTFKSIGH